MTRNTWEARNARAVDLTVRCDGKRVMQILRGDPAPVLEARSERGAELVLAPTGLALKVLATADDGLPATLTWLEAHEINCPNHKGGHFVDASKLWAELAEARRMSLSANVEVRRVSRPYFDGSDPFA